LSPMGRLHHASGAFKDGNGTDFQWPNRVHVAIGPRRVSRCWLIQPRLKGGILRAATNGAFLLASR
jgi:hypothetical protein